MSDRVKKEVFHDNFMRIVKEKRMKLDDIAKRVHLSNGSKVSEQIRPGTAMPNIHRLVEYADILGVSIDDLIGRQIPASDSAGSAYDPEQLCRILYSLWDSGIIHIAPAFKEKVDYEGMDYDEHGDSVETVQVYKICFPVAFDIKPYLFSDGNEEMPEGAMKNSLANKGINALLEGLYKLQAVLNSEDFTDDMKQIYIDGLMSRVMKHLKDTADSEQNWRKSFFVTPDWFEDSDADSQ